MKLHGTLLHDKPWAHKASNCYCLSSVTDKRQTTFVVHLSRHLIQNPKGDDGKTGKEQIVGLVQEVVVEVLSRGEREEGEEELRQHQESVLVEHVHRNLHVSFATTFARSSA